MADSQQPSPPSEQPSPSAESTSPSGESTMADPEQPSPSPGHHGEEEMASLAGRAILEMLAAMQPTSPRRARARPHRAVRSREQERKQREQNKFACFKCQKKKIKCSNPAAKSNNVKVAGQWPPCEGCVKRNDVCEYPVSPGAVSRMADLKQTSKTLERENEELERENEVIKELFHRLSSLPASEALEALRSDPLSVLKDGRDAEPGGNATANREVARIDAEALAESPIKVPGKPWTSVAGDGLVSHLISDFFDRDEGPFVNTVSILVPELFIKDMQLGDPSQSQFCSPLLVNTICGLRSMFSEKVRRVNQATNTNLSQLFVTEAKKHFETEAEKRRLTTIQGLYFLFLLTCHIAITRAGSVYRLAALDILEKLQVDKVLSKRRGNAHGNTNKRRAIFKTYWGIFNFECILCHTYLKPPSIGLIPLSVPPDESDGNESNFNVFRSRFRSAPGQPTIAPRTVPLVNRISDLQYRVMRYNNGLSGNTVGDLHDMRVREYFLFQLDALENSLPASQRYKQTRNRQTIQNQIYLNMVTYNILRPLPSSTRVVVRARTPQDDDPTTAKTILINLSSNDIGLITTYIDHYGSPKYAPGLIIPLWSTVYTLLPFLDDPDAARVFMRGCALLEVFERDLKGVRMFRRGVLAIAWRIGARIAPAAKRFLGGLEEEVRRGEVELRDVPVDFVIAVPREVWTRVMGVDEGGYADEEVVGLDLARILGQWGEMLKGRGRVGW